MREIRLILHDIRSTHNVGSLLRTAEGMGVTQVYMSGYTPYPRSAHDDRLPYIIDKLDKQIHKTALGAEGMVAWEVVNDVEACITELQKNNFEVVALEQSRKSISLPQYKPTDKIAILIGREVEGIEDRLIQQCDTCVEIPMFGKKESFNVVQATAMLLSHARFA